MDYKEQLRQELLKRAALEQEKADSDDAKIRSMIADQEKIALMDPSYRFDLNPTVDMVNLGMDPKWRIGKTEPQESTQDALRKALAYKLQQPKANPAKYIDALSRLSKGDNRSDKEQQRMRESALKTKQGQNIIRSRELQDKVNTYQNLVNTHGFEVTGEKKAALESAYRELQIAYKNAAELGVIAGPDMMLIEGIAPPSMGFAGGARYLMSGGKEGVNNALNELKKSRENEIESNMKVLQSVYPDPSTQQALGAMFRAPNQPVHQPKADALSIPDKSGVKAMSDADIDAELAELERIIGR